MASIETRSGTLHDGDNPIATHPFDNIEDKPLHVSEDAPDGGRRAWLVAAGAAFITFASLGYSNSVGVFQEYYLSHQLKGQSPDDVAWIGSVAAFLQFTVGAVAGPMFDRYGAWIIRPAAVLLIFSVMMTSLCENYWQFMLAQGVLNGLVIGLLLIPAMAAVSQYFDKRRAAALGLTVSGSSVGGVVFPIALSKMLNGSTLGFGWSVRIAGFLMVPCLAFSCLTVQARRPPRKTKFFIGEAFKKATYLLLVLSCFFVFLGMFTPIFYLAVYAVQKGMDATLASYLLAILNGASTFGRIIPGILADKFGRLNIFGLGGVITGIIILCWTTAESTAGLVVYAVFFGFWSGTIISGAAAAFSVCVEDTRDLGTYMGMGLGVGAIAILIGPPINGALVERYGGFLQVSIFSGVTCIAGGFTALASKFATPQGVFGNV
ncbi:uncharacterized protein A1O9_06320 [Exophiala aquamarina CBS 119918]|uniref:Major facilitator superfamily (MFS) profile domain-containing protein n=1 Tax=Exophiala aquamarina CBS 119918 TaxID=1182545 RepID=A0A072PE79_9EURO|nr:uncharacterized protein A1O9_06320 [Exophiala aquamarina CBS 119918]KEF58394.1 hypothetical protein A1O9_06320 [Exophiala aquamarina CBS 119918]